MLGKHLWADMNAPLTTTTYSTQEVMLGRGKAGQSGKGEHHGRAQAGMRVHEGCTRADEWAQRAVSLSEHRICH